MYPESLTNWPALYHLIGCTHTRYKLRRTVRIQPMLCLANIMSWCRTHPKRSPSFSPCTGADGVRSTMLGHASFSLTTILWSWDYCPIVSGLVRRGWIICGTSHQRELGFRSRCNDSNPVLLPFPKAESSLEKIHSPSVANVLEMRILL